MGKMKALIPSVSFLWLTTQNFPQRIAITIVRHAGESVVNSVGESVTTHIVIATDCTIQHDYRDLLMNLGQYWF